MAGKKVNAIVVGGEPRIDFLPPEINERKDAKRLFRGLIIVLVGIVAICLVVYAGVTTLAISRQVALADEQGRSLALIAAQGEHSEARDAATTLDIAKSARLVASAPEVMWREQLLALQGTLPEGAAITSYSVTSQSATGMGPAAEGLLAAPQVAQVTVSGTFPTVQSVATWQDSLETLHGFAGVWVSAITDAEGVYEVQATVGIQSEAFAFRLFTPVEADAEAESVPEAEGSN